MFGKKNAPGYRAHCGYGDVKALKSLPRYSQIPLKTRIAPFVDSSRSSPSSFASPLFLDWAKNRGKKGNIGGIGMPPLMGGPPGPLCAPPHPKKCTIISPPCAIYSTIFALFWQNNSLVIVGNDRILGE